MTQMQIELPEEQVIALEKLAKQRNVSLSELIQEEINKLLPAESVSGDEDLKRRAVAAAGRFRSGRGDLSRRHDDYFAETQGL